MKKPPYLINRRLFMSISKFRYNKRRKHYSYSFKKNNSRVKNILLTSKPVRKEHLDAKENIKLFKHPNPNSDKQAYLIRFTLRLSFG